MDTLVALGGPEVTSALGRWESGSRAQPGWFQSGRSGPRPPNPLPFGFGSGSVLGVFFLPASLVYGSF